MDNAQLTTLASGLRASADATVIAALAIRNDVALQVWCNAKASPTALAWNEQTAQENADDAPDYSTFDTLAAGKRDSWALFLDRGRDFTRQKVRKWVTDVWGNATGGSNAEAILQAGTTPITNGQAIFGGTDATTGTVTAKKRNFAGYVSLDDVSNSLNRF